MAQCTYCGKPLVAGANFCTWCGHKVKQTQAKADVEAALASLDSDDPQDFDVVSSTVERAPSPTRVGRPSAPSSGDRTTSSGDSRAEGPRAEKPDTHAADVQTPRAEASDDGAESSEAKRPDAAGEVRRADTDARDESAEGASGEAPVADVDDSAAAEAPETADSAAVPGTGTTGSAADAAGGASAGDAAASAGTDVDAEAVTAAAAGPASGAAADVASKTGAAGTPAHPKVQRVRDLDIPTINPGTGAVRSTAPRVRRLSIPEVTPSRAAAVNPSAQTRVAAPITPNQSANQGQAAQTYRSGAFVYTQDANRSFVNPMAGNVSTGTDYGARRRSGNGVGYDAGRMSGTGMSASRTTVLNPVSGRGVNRSGRPYASAAGFSEQRTSIMKPVETAEYPHSTAVPNDKPGSTQSMPAVEKQKARDAVPMPNPAPKRHPVVKGIFIGVLIAAVFWAAYYYFLVM